MSKTRLFYVVVIVALVASSLGAQSKPAEGELTFDAVSVKPNTTGASSASIGGAGDRWRMVNVSAAGLILTAYPGRTSELLGAPAWVTSERFNVEARATFTPTRDQERTMLRALLADRFKLAAHVETQERPIYNLVVARADGRLGPQLRRIEIDCESFDPKAPAPVVPALAGFDVPPCSVSMSGGKGIVMVSGGRTLQSLADAIAPRAERPVFDKTALTGYYAYRLEYGRGADEAALFTAVQEQLGLKLEPARGPVDILSIDHIERPTEN